MKKILITSNPFGYGPTGQTIKLILDLQNYFSTEDIEVKLFFVGSGLCKELVENIRGITIFESDERSVAELKSIINSIGNIDLCIGIQNKFIPIACKELNIRCYFVDGLAWFWDKYPNEYLIADRIFWTDFPYLKEKKIPNKKISIIGDLTNSISCNSASGDDFILFSLGGQKNPLRRSLQYNYLNLVNLVLSKIATDSLRFVVTGGVDAIQYLKKINSSIFITYKTVPHKTNMQLLSICKLFISVGGQSSTFEASASNVPTVFFLPSNLSQFSLQKTFRSEIFWKKYVNVDSNFLKLTENQAIDEIELFSNLIIKSETLLKNLEIDMINTICNEKEIKKNSKFYKKIKHIGSKEIYTSIIKDFSILKNAE